MSGAAAGGIGMWCGGRAGAGAGGGAGGAAPAEWYVSTAPEKTEPRTNIIVMVVTTGSTLFS